MAAALPTPLVHSRAIRGALGVALAVLLALAMLETRLNALHASLVARRPVDEATLPTPRAVRALALGHAEWAADLLWTNALLYFGETLANHQQQRYLQRYAETIEAVDPSFRQVYLWAATVSIYNTRTIRRESVEASIAHLERGLRRFPDDGEMLYQLGFDYFFELPRLVDDADERAEVRRRGAEYLRRAAALGYGPPWMALAAADALQRAGLADRAIEALRSMYLRTDDAAVRARIAEQIAQLEGEGADRDPFLVEVQRLDTERRAAFPYVGPLLYLFVGPPVPGVATVVQRTEPDAPPPATDRASDAGP